MLNAAYAAITMWMSKKDHEKFDRELLARASEGGVSHGTSALMAVMGVHAPAHPMGRPADGKARR